MNLGKQDLDALLDRWPAPLPGGGMPGQDAVASGQDEERRWDERADATLKAVLVSKGEGASKEASVQALDALFAAPALAPEPGEGSVMLLSGEKKMTQEKEPGDLVASKPPESMVGPPTERKRTSLKEIAARASQASGRPSAPGARPSSPGGPPSSAPPRPPSVTPPPRPVEAGRDDSGVINLDVVRASATAQQVASAEKAKPAQAGLFEDDPTVESAASSGAQPAPARPTKVAVVSAKKSYTSAVAGAAIAVLGIAAAFAIIVHKQAPAPTASAIGGEARPATVTAAPSATPQAVAQAPSAKAAATEAAVASAAPATTADSDSKPAEVARGGPVAVPAAPSPPLAGKDAVADAKGAAKGAPVATGNPGDLKSEMARAVGSKDGDKPAEAAPTPEPASGGTRNQDVPEQPSQGSAQSAVGAVIGGAKGCVAGADDISRAQITFSSSGSVSSVSVTGWAAAHGKSACIQAALKGAKVGPFSKSSFTVPVAIRP
jgi:hypothetical protein